MAEDIYYRNLYSKVHRGRWDQGLFNSTNERHGIPKEWVTAAVSGKPVEKYPLAADGVLFGTTARERFVAFVDALRAESAASPPSGPRSTSSPCTSESNNWNSPACCAVHNGERAVR